jgi:hypothetical protein
MNMDYQVKNLTTNNFENTFIRSATVLPLTQGYPAGVAPYSGTSQAESMRVSVQDRTRSNLVQDTGTGILSGLRSKTHYPINNDGIDRLPDPPTYAPIGTDVLNDCRFKIPGVGSITDEKICGTWKTSAACSNDPTHFTRHFKNSCGNPLCPECFGSWMNKAANRIAQRLRGYIREANAGQFTLDDTPLAVWHKDNTRYLNHYVVSPRKDEIKFDWSYQKIRQVGMKMAQRMGVTGGEGFFHPYRVTKTIQLRLKYLCRETTRMTEDEQERKFWELIRDDALKLGSWTKYVEWSPHYHIIGFGRLPDQRTQEQKDEFKRKFAGWIIHWVRHVNTARYFTGQDMHDEIIELAAYLLSHSGYELSEKGKGRNIPIDFGVCGRNQLKKLGDPEQESYQVVCPKCGSKVIMGTMDGNFIPDTDKEGQQIPYKLLSSTQRYRIKDLVPLQDYQTNLCYSTSLGEIQPYDERQFVTYELKHSPEYLQLVGALNGKQN